MPEIRCLSSNKEENMGTRSTILFINNYEDGETPLAKIYQQYDGYLEGVGMQLCSYILGKKIVNGYTTEQQNGLYANGFDDLVTMFIADHKHGIGNLHLITPTTDRSTNEFCDYNYEVIYEYTLDLVPDGIPANALITIRVFNWDENEPFFVGSPLDLMQYIKKRRE